MIQGTFVSATEAADTLGCTTGRVRQLLIAGELEGFKLTPRSWAVKKTSVDKAKKNTPKTGRPRGAKNISE